MDSEPAVLGAEIPLGSREALSVLQATARRLGRGSASFGRQAQACPWGRDVRTRERGREENRYLDYERSRHGERCLRGGGRPTLPNDAERAEGDCDRPCRSTTLHRHLA